MTPSIFSICKNHWPDTLQWLLEMMNKNPTRLPTDFCLNQALMGKRISPFREKSSFTIAEKPDSSQANRRFFLFSRYTNCHLLKKLLKNLKAHDDAAAGTGSSSLFIDLVLDPDSWGGTESILSTEQENIVRQVECSLSLQTSQKSALRNCAQKQLQCIWGPPGAGKTFFIGALVTTLLLMNPQNYKVLICSSTHSAADNCLERIAITFLETLPDELKRGVEPKFFKLLSNTGASRPAPHDSVKRVPGGNREA
jgi:hypothetical protein